MALVIVILVVVFIATGIIEERQNADFRDRARKFFGEDWDR